MGIVKKFKDFFRVDKNTSIDDDLLDSRKRNLKAIDSLESTREEIGYLLHDFQDLGFEVEIFNDHYKKGSDTYRYLHISLVIKNKSDISDQFEADIKTALCELKFRMDEIPNAKIDRSKFRYKGTYTNYRGLTVVKEDIIFLGFSNTTVEQAMSDSLSFKVRILKGPKIRRLRELEINIYTNPIVIN